MSESLYTTHIFEIEFDKYGEEIIIQPFSDVHLFAPMCADDVWKRDLEIWKKRKNCYYLGLGDYMDLLSSTERDNLSLKKAHESTEETIEKFYVLKSNEFLKQIEFMKNRLIGMVEGNHHIKYSWGATNTQMMCQQMNCKYLGGCSFIRLILKYAKGHNYFAVDIVAHHGRSGGRMPSSSINSLYHTANGFNADIILFGHDHNKLADYINRLELTNNKGSLNVINKKILIARCGCYLKGYESGRISYATKALYPPSDIGSISIKLTPVVKFRNGVEDRYVDIQCTI